MRRRLPLPIAITGALALLVAGLAWSRALRDGRVTGPNRVEWRGPDDQPLAYEQLGSAPCQAMLRADLVHDGRLIVACTLSSRSEHQGYAWIDPARGAAKIAWPIPSGPAIQQTLAYAPGPDGALGIVYAAHEGGRDVLVAAIAGRDGWLVAPVTIDAEPPGRSRIGPDLLGAVYRDGGLEVVLTRFRPDTAPRAPLALEVVRIRGGGEPRVQRTVLPASADCLCRLEFALPTPRGWKVATRVLGLVNRAAFIDEAGALAEVPGGWWSEQIEVRATDRSPVGIIDHLSGPRYVLTLDGSRRPPEPSPLPGFEPIYWMDQPTLQSGPEGLRRKLVWRRDADDLTAQAAAGRVVVSGPSAGDPDVMRLGDHPDRMRPVLRGEPLSSSRTAVILPGPSGTSWWVTLEGEYVTLDASLRRTDPRSLVHHMRTRGSTYDWVDERGPIYALGWALFGLPIALVLGLGLAWLRRRLASGAASPSSSATKPLSLCLALYAATGLLAFVHTLPLT